MTRLVIGAGLAEPLYDHGIMADADSNNDASRPPLLVEIHDPKSRRERVIVWTSLVVSVCALLATAVSIWLGHQHNKLSVVPKLDFAYELRADREKVGLFLRSTGAGPARIKRFSVSLPGRPDVEIRVAPLYAAVLGAVNHPRDVVWTEYYEGDHIRPGTEAEVFVAPTKDLKSPVLWERFLKCDLEVTIEYCSLYESECEPRTSHGQCPIPVGATIATP